MAKLRRFVSNGARPEVEDIEKQANPAFAPEFATHACLRVVESATLIGNSPSVFTGWPSIFSFVGSIESIVNLDKGRLVSPDLKS